MKHLPKLSPETKRPTHRTTGPMATSTFDDLINSAAFQSLGLRINAYHPVDKTYKEYDLLQFLRNLPEDKASDLAATNTMARLQVLAQMIKHWAQLMLQLKPDACRNPQARQLIHKAQLLIRSVEPELKLLDNPALGELAVIGLQAIEQFSETKAWVNEKQHPLWTFLSRERDSGKLAAELIRSSLLQLHHDDKRLPKLKPQTFKHLNLDLDLRIKIPIAIPFLSINTHITRVLRWGPRGHRLMQALNDCLDCLPELLQALNPTDPKICDANNPVQSWLNRFQAMVDDTPQLYECLTCTQALIQAAAITLRRAPAKASVLDWLLADPNIDNPLHYFTGQQRLSTPSPAQLQGLLGHNRMQQQRLAKALANDDAADTRQQLITTLTIARHPQSERILAAAEQYRKLFYTYRASLPAAYKQTAQQAEQQADKDNKLPNWLSSDLALAPATLTELTQAKALVPGLQFNTLRNLGAQLFKAVQVLHPNPSTVTPPGSPATMRQHLLWLAKQPYIRDPAVELAPARLKQTARYSYDELEQINLAVTKLRQQQFPTQQALQAKRKQSINAVADSLMHLYPSLDFAGRQLQQQKVHAQLATCTNLTALAQRYLSRVKTFKPIAHLRREPAYEDSKATTAVYHQTLLGIKTIVTHFNKITKRQLDQIQSPLSHKWVAPQSLMQDLSHYTTALSELKQRLRLALAPLQRFDFSKAGIVDQLSPLITDYIEQIDKRLTQPASNNHVSYQLLQTLGNKYLDAPMQNNFAGIQAWDEVASINTELQKVLATLNDEHKPMPTLDPMLATAALAFNPSQILAKAPTASATVDPNQAEHRLWQQFQATLTQAANRLTAMQQYRDKNQCNPFISHTNDPVPFDNRQAVQQALAAVANINPLRRRTAYQAMFQVINCLHEIITIQYERDQHVADDALNTLDKFPAIGLSEQSTQSVKRLGQYIGFGTYGKYVPLKALNKTDLPQQYLQDLSLLKNCLNAWTGMRHAETHMQAQFANTVSAQQRFAQQVSTCARTLQRVLYAPNTEDDADICKQQNPKVTALLQAYPLVPQAVTPKLNNPPTLSNTSCNTLQGAVQTLQEELASLDSRLLQLKPIASQLQQLQADKQAHLGAKRNPIADPLYVAATADAQQLYLDTQALIRTTTHQHETIHQLVTALTPLLREHETLQQALHDARQHAVLAITNELDPLRRPVQDFCLQLLAVMVNGMGWLFGLTAPLWQPRGARLTLLEKTLHAHMQQLDIDACAPAGSALDEKRQLRLPDISADILGPSDDPVQQAYAAIRVSPALQGLAQAAIQVRCKRQQTAVSQQPLPQAIEAKRAVSSTPAKSITPELDARVRAQATETLPAAATQPNNSHHPVAKPVS